MEWILVWTNKQQKGVILDRKCISLSGAFYPFRCKERKMSFISEVETRHPIVRHESAQMWITGSAGPRTTRRLGQSFSTETNLNRAKNSSGRPHAPWPTSHGDIEKPHTGPRACASTREFGGFPDDYPLCPHRNASSTVRVAWPPSNSTAAPLPAVEVRQPFFYYRHSPSPMAIVAPEASSADRVLPAKIASDDHGLWTFGGCL
jgi:hypothetical protein